MAPNSALPAAFATSPDTMAAASTERPLRSGAAANQAKSVCVIGAGPGGMFFCYHMDQKLRKANSNNANSSIRIQCFERASSPGGVWRKADETDTSDCVEMYDNLWTNGASHNMEFDDYTFDDHFQQPVHVYLQRKHVLDYMMKRVTRNTPDLFERYMQFNTEVQNVTFDRATRKFRVRTNDLVRNLNHTQDFDYCIWAAGENGQQKMPKQTVHKLRAGGFKGQILHSADSADLEATVKGKRIVLIGGSYSAEDLAIQAVKLGVEHVDIVCRSSEAHVFWTETWPGNKVDVHTQTQILDAKGDNTLRLEYLHWDWKAGYVGYGESEHVVLENIDAVLFCTGYGAAHQMLDPNLLYKQGKIPIPDLPKDWKMSPNQFDQYLGHVEPTVPTHYGWSHSPDLYHGVVIENPQMMFFQDLTSSPMMDHDAFAYLFAQLISGDLPCPTKDEMKAHNLKRAIAEMNMPHRRIYMDLNYYNAIGKVPGVWASEGVSDIWCAELSRETSYSIKLLADIMQAANYPVSLGTFEHLNEAGKRIAQHDILSDHHRYVKARQQNGSKHRKDWTTFRDYSNGDAFESIHTGTKAINIDMKWLDM